jgi:hypothetical protein
VTGVDPALAEHSREHRWNPWKTAGDPVPILEQARQFIDPTIQEQATTGLGSLSGELRYATPVFLRFEGLDYHNDPDARSKLDRYVRDVAVRFENTGTAHLRVKSSVEIRDETTRVVQRIEGPEAYITPRAFRDIIVRVPALPRGRYVAVVLLDHGADEITATQLELEVP